MNNIHKLLHSAFEQAVLWEYLDYNPFKKSQYSENIFAGDHNAVPGSD